MTTEETLARQVDKQLESLRREFEELPPGRVTELGEAKFERLRANARITEFIPVLVYRYTREELRSIKRDELHSAA